ncbi:MAG: ABC transporter ATP-binding protein [Verrucomicrobiae bacterium]|nr:ABC transporter ATP-binding protein [Verrucomicrobiae bacterium]
MTPSLDVRNLCYAYPDGRVALDGVSLSVAEGERVALIGPNGAGKSTLLQCLNGLLPARLPREAAVRVFGTPLGETTADGIRRSVGLLFQDPDDQFLCPTVREEVRFGPEQFGWEEARIEEAVADALARAGIPDFGPREPHHLSRGEKRRVCLAAVLACSPRLLLLDEPTTDLDPRGKRELREVLRTLPVTILLATHDLEMVVDLCPRAVLLDRGRVIANRPTFDLLSDEPLMLAHGLERPHILSHRHPHG